MDPAARVRKITLIASLVNCRPTAVPTNVGAPPMSPMSRRKPQEGGAFSAARGDPTANPPGGAPVLGPRGGHHADPLRPVVQRDPDDQDGGQPDLAAGGAAADGQPF